MSFIIRTFLTISHVTLRTALQLLFPSIIVQWKERIESPIEKL